MSIAEPGIRLVGASAAMRELDAEVRRAARSDAKILITGESGVGKEVVARLAHRYSARSTRPFVAMNCAGVPDSLLESELFGHVKGSFTGAYRDKPGLLEQAHTGTMFMDEVGEMSLRMQALLLRFLEDGDIHRVGADRRSGSVNVRIVAATNRVLLDRIAAGQFREDLYYRLNVIHLTVSPLRDRRDDIDPLLHHFLETFATKYGVTMPVLSPEVMAEMQAYDWPGNVRELKNVAERLIVRAREGVITLADLPPSLLGGVVVADAQVVAAAAATPNPTLRLVPSTPPRLSPAHLVERMIGHQESFWSAVYAPFMARNLTRDDVRALISVGLQHTRGNYKLLLGLFNMEATDYKRFLNFLRKHECHMPFQDFRNNSVTRTVDKTMSAAAS